MKKRLSVISIILIFMILITSCDMPASSNDESQNEYPTSNPEHCGDHSDQDNDGTCDVCGITVLVYIDFYAINDLHGKFDDTSSNEGVDELTTYLKKASATDENVILLSSGDMWQGGAASNLTKGHIITEWMNALDFVSMTLGNHEYDWGEMYIESNNELAEFPFLAINIYDRETNELVDYCDSSVIVEKDGLQIGIIGAIGDCYSSIAGDKSEDVYFKVGDELTELVKAESQKLRSEGVDYIVYSIHDGHSRSQNDVGTINDGSLGAYYDIELSDGYVDLVFEGHTHKNYVLKDSKGVYHLQNGGDNKGISHVEISINTVNYNSSVTQAEFVATNDYSSLADDPLVDQLLEKYNDHVQLANVPLCKLQQGMSSNEIEALVAKLYYEEGKTIWGNNYDIVLGGGYISTRSPYNLAPGEITYGDLCNIMPFDNQLVLCSIKGVDLKNKFFESNNSNYHIFYGEYGKQVKANLDPSATYYIIVDSYTSLYAPNRLTVIDEYEENIFARDLLAKYFSDFKPQTDSSTEASTEGVPELIPEDIVITSIPEIIRIGESLENNGTTSDHYYVKGKIISIDNSTYGNLTIEDEDGNQLYIYGVSSHYNVRYGSMPYPPLTDDVIIIKAPIKKYYKESTNKTIIELYNSQLIFVLKTE